MRVTGRSLRSEEGVAAVVLAIVLVALVGMVSLTIDGGLLFAKHRGVRTANDAAALAAAASCGRSEGRPAADAQADLLAVTNVAGAVRFVDPVYVPSCDAPSGSVTVQYETQQELFFSQVVGVSSPRQVRATATAAWGGAGVAERVVPLALSVGRLGSCGIPDGADVGDRCYFRWDGGGPGDRSADAEWGLADLSTWGVTSGASCPGSASQGEFGGWIAEGYGSPLELADPPPVYVCRPRGDQGNALANDVDAIAGRLVPMPVNDPSRQVQSNGAPCRPGGLDGECSVHKYAIVGFAILEIVHVWTGADARDRCGGSGPGAGGARCLEAIWRGYRTGGVRAGGANFGLIGISLTE